MKHKWSEKIGSDEGHSSRKVCTRDGCEIVCVSRHELNERGFQQHWKEWFRGTELIQRGGNTPVCEAVEVPA
ncbi:cytochrome C [Bradyrhizobium liaoningense]|uniref:cytochrome C n=1 Tax=Bradyrhizobium liaoningense TaxID=43992 RepID=UPI001BA7CEA3|nr:cytochrome C [Bradyrhizobium liaoningense]MBR1170518.1 cytochrome C [Bradyrhizobium liaoningense]